MNKRTEPERLHYLYTNLQDELALWMCKYWYQDEWEDYNNSTDLYWIGGGMTLGISDIFVDMEEIVFLATHDVPRDTFSDGYWYNVEAPEGERCNIQSYVKIRGTGTHEDFLKFQSEQKAMRESPEHKEQLEKELKKIWDDEMEKLEKYIKKTHKDKPIN